MHESTTLQFFNTMWGADLDTAGLPCWCRIVTGRDDHAEADAIVFHLPTLKQMPVPNRPGQLWVAWSMECDVNYPKLRDPEFMAQFDISMTYTLDSDIPVTYLTFYSEGDGIESSLRMAPGPKSPDRLATMFVSSGLNKSGRLQYAKELMRYLDVHSYGKAHGNRPIPPPDRGRASKLRLLSEYKFDLSFENAIGDDYVTEKFYDPLVAGTVPIYLGAPNVDAFAPGEKCFINTADFANPKELADYLLYLNHDDVAYAEYFAWKEKPFLPSFQHMVDQQSKPAFARLCEVVRARSTATDGKIEEM